MANEFVRRRVRHPFLDARRVALAPRPAASRPLKMRGLRDKPIQPLPSPTAGCRIQSPGDASGCTWAPLDGFHMDAELLSINCLSSRIASQDRLLRPGCRRSVAKRASQHAPSYQLSAHHGRDGAGRRRDPAFASHLHRRFTGGFSASPGSRRDFPAGAMICERSFCPLLIGRSGSSALSDYPPLLSMSLTARASYESAPRPFHHGSENEVEQSF